MGTAGSPASRRSWTFARRCGYSRLGLAHCIGLQDEAAVVKRVFEANGLRTEAVACKAGALPKEVLGLTDDDKVAPGEFESMCNPIGQARLLAEAGTELNVLLGLCVGHDSLFFKHSVAPVTVLAAKDRVLGHNPLAADLSGGRVLPRPAVPGEGMKKSGPRPPSSTVAGRSLAAPSGGPVPGEAASSAQAACAAFCALAASVASACTCTRPK